MSTHHERNRKLVAAGLAKTPADANGLRQRIEKSGQTVDQYIAANSQESQFGPGGSVKPLKSDVAAIGEVRALMNQEGLSHALATLLRQSIISSGQSVADFIGADAQASGFGSVGGQSVNPLLVFRQAQTLVNTAGNREKAIKAIELITSFDLEGSGEESGSSRGGGRRG